MRRPALAAALVAAGASLAACGGGGAAQSGARSAPPVASAAPAQAVDSAGHAEPPHVATGFATSADGVKIAYKSVGAGDAAAVLVHCWGCNKSYWDATAAALSADVRVVTLDLAGHGESGKDRKEWTVQSFAQDVIAVMDALGLKRVVLVGHSMSGPIVLEVASRVPDRVVAVAPIDTVKDASHPLPDAKRKAWFDRMRADFRGTTDKIVRSLFPASADAKVVERVVADELAQDPVTAIPILENDFAYREDQTLPKIRVPLRGFESDLSPTDVEGNRTLAPQFEMTALAGVGHWPMLESPGRFDGLLADAVVPWLDPTYVEGSARAPDGVVIHYRAFGGARKEAPAVVFVHGWCGNMHVWDETMRTVARNGSRVVALDLAGHGLSGRNREKWTMEAFAADVRAVVEQLGLAKVVLVGHSISGAIVVEAARAMPERVAAVVPVDSLLDVDAGPDADEQKVIDRMKTDFVGATKTMLDFLFLPGADPAVKGRVIDECLTTPAAVAVPSIDAAAHHSVTAALSQVKAPIRAINTDRFPTKLEAARKYAPQYQVAIVTGTGHWPMLEAPERFDPLLLAALRELVRP